MSYLWQYVNYMLLQTYPTEYLRPAAGLIAHLFLVCDSPDQEARYHILGPK
jgi:hypothetical protein